MSNVGVGASCHVLGRSAGVVRWFGAVEFAAGVWVGVELSKIGSGKNDGSVLGVRYFNCQHNTGVFVRPEQVTFDVQAAATTRIQSLQRARKDRSSQRQIEAFKCWNAIEGSDELQHLSATRAVSMVDSYMQSVHGAAPQRTQPAPEGRAPAPPPSYTGPRITYPVTRSQAVRLVAHFRETPDLPLHARYARDLIVGMLDVLRTTVDSAVFDLTIDRGQRLRVLGDTHGQLADFLYILQQHGLPSAENPYLVNGDIADRGGQARERALTVACARARARAVLLLMLSCFGQGRTRAKSS